MPLIYPSPRSAGLTVATGTPSIIDPAHLSPVILPSVGLGLMLAAGTPSVIDVPPLPPPEPIRITHGSRERDVRNAMVDLLSGTAQFDLVTVSADKGEFANAPFG